MDVAHSITDQVVWDVLETVTDPEIPVLTVVDLGIACEIHINGETVEVVITPTYSGCPAMNTIEQDIHTALENAGFENAKITTVLSPAWTTDWMTESGKNKLKEYGIAPPVHGTADKRVLLGERPVVSCPQCGG